MKAVVFLCHALAARERKIKTAPVKISQNH
jgi:hypothetical protein